MRIAVFVFLLAALCACVFCGIRLAQLDKKQNKLLNQLIDETLSLRDSYRKGSVDMPIDVIVEAVRSAMNGSFEEGQEP